MGTPNKKLLTEKEISTLSDTQLENYASWTNDFKGRALEELNKAKITLKKTRVQKATKNEIHAKQKDNDEIENIKNQLKNN